MRVQDIPKRNSKFCPDCGARGRLDDVETRSDDAAVHFSGDDRPRDSA